MEQIKGLKAKFDLVSRDGRTIKKEDAITVIRAAGQNPSQKEFSRALMEANINHDSVLTFDEFKIFAGTIWTEEPMEDALSQAFKRFDRNHSGKIDTKEFREIMLNYGEALSQTEFDELMKLADRDHDGKISYSEFIRLFTEVLDD